MDYEVEGPHVEQDAQINIVRYIPYNDHKTVIVASKNVLGGLAAFEDGLSGSERTVKRHRASVAKA